MQLAEASRGGAAVTRCDTSLGDGPLQIGISQRYLCRSTSQIRYNTSMLEESLQFVSWRLGAGWLPEQHSSPTPENAVGVCKNLQELKIQPRRVTNSSLQAKIQPRRVTNSFTLETGPKSSWKKAPASSGSRDTGMLVDGVRDGGSERCTAQHGGRTGSPSHSLPRGPHSGGMKGKSVFVLKALAQNGVLGRRRWRDPSSAGRALHQPSGRRGWLQLARTNFMTLSQSLHPPISLKSLVAAYSSALPVWITDTQKTLSLPHANTCASGTGHARLAQPTEGTNWCMGLSW